MTIKPARMLDSEIQNYVKSVEAGGSGGFSFGHVRALLGHILALEEEIKRLQPPELSLMSQITVRSNWGYFDHLEGRDLEEHDSIIVRWPDETEEPLQVKIERIHERGALMNGDGDILTTRAYTVKPVHGLPTKVYLAGLPARRL